MKKIILLVCGFLMFSLLSCTEEYKHKKKSEMLLKQAKETELEALYDKMVEYLDKDENFQFVKEKNRYFIKDEALNYVMRSLYNFHKENHLPILQDKEHPENWDDWFYFYKFIVNFDGNESLDKLDQYNKLTTACDYCRLAYQNETDITWPTINPDTINDFSTIKDAALNTITRLNEAKQKADAQEAERQRQEAEKKQRAEAEKKRQEEERRRIEASKLTGVNDYKFGMSKSEVEKKVEKNTGRGLSPIDIGMYGSEPNIAEVFTTIFGDDYGGIYFSPMAFLFMNDKLYKVYLIFDGNTYNDAHTIAKIKSLVNSIVSKYEFNTKPLDGSIDIGNFRIHGRKYNKFDKTEVFYGSIEQGFGAYSAIITFEDIKIRENNYNKALQKYKDTMKNRTDF